MPTVPAALGSEPSVVVGLEPEGDQCRYTNEVCGYIGVTILRYEFRTTCHICFSSVISVAGSLEGRASGAN